MVKMTEDGFTVVNPGEMPDPIEVRATVTPIERSRARQLLDDLRDAQDAKRQVRELAKRAGTYAR